MKRSPIKRRSAPHRTTAIRTQNPERQAKRRKRQASKHRAYMRSETRKIVDARANGQCERVITVGPLCYPVRMEAFELRCPETTRLQHHHLTYMRYGGDELPEDMLKVCRRCHDYLEAEHPTRQSHLRQAGRARSEESDTND